MSSTADRWFVPDHEYFKSIRDYAVIGWSATDVRDCLDLKDKSRLHFTDEDATFMTEYDPPDVWDLQVIERLYNFGHPGRLLYADVDDKDPAHKAKVYGEIAKEIPIEEKNEKTTEVMKQLVKKLAPIWYKQKDVPEDQKESAQEENERKALNRLEGLIEKELVTPRIASCILTAKTVEEKKEILNLFSGQTSHRTKRPVLSLISMIDRKTTEMDKTVGWVTAYDFIKDLLLIKPFVSKAGKHPLAEKWYGDVAQDGVSFCSTPQDFTKAYIQWEKTVDAGKANEHDGYKMMVHTRAAEWIYHLGIIFETVYGSEFHADHLALKEAIAKIKEAMEQLKFPIVEKDETDRKFDFLPMRCLLDELESDESWIRGTALEAREKGEEKIAQNAAKLYESIHEQIKAFIENPSMDL